MSRRNRATLKNTPRYQTSKAVRQERRTVRALKGLPVVPLLILMLASSAAAEPHPGARPCNHEDGSGDPLPCVWDARHMGNGAGRSYVLYRNEPGDVRINYVTHRWAHRLVWLWKR